MFKRFILILISTILVISVAITSIYYINPFDLKTDNIRPRVFGFDIYQIPSKSMRPLLFPGDYIMVSNLAYLKSSAKRKDVIVFNLADKNNPSLKTPFIKRVLAIAGDTIELQNGKLFVNKQFVDEAYIAKSNNKTPYSLTFKPIQVPPNHVFVMGDNRDNSSDSRIFGTIKDDTIVAKAVKILYGKNSRSGNEIK